VASFDRDNGASSAENCWVPDKWSSTKVRGDTNSLENAGSANHVLGSVKVEVVLARLHWLRSSLSDGSHQLRDVRSLSLPNSLESCDLCWLEAKRSKV
jgi:hypothetical protein